MSKTTALILCIAVFSLVQIVTWVQLNGQFFSSWFKNNVFILCLMGIPISWLYIEATRYGFNSTLDKITMIPHSDTVKAAWMTAEVAIKSYHVVNRNNNKFSDDKVMKKMAKDFE